MIYKGFTYFRAKSIFTSVRTKNKKMILKIPHSKYFIDRIRSTPVLVISSIVAIAAVFIIGPRLVGADAYQAQINALQSQNTNTQSQISSLQNQATSYQNAIGVLNSQINGLQQAITINQTKQSQLQQHISETQQQIIKDKKTLSDDVETMYINGAMTPIEALATSNNLSSYVDQQVAYSTIQNALNSMIKKIASLQVSLKTQSNQLQIVINSQQQQNNQLVADQSQQQQLLTYNQNQQSSFNQQIATNQAKMATLIQEQIAANRALVSTGTVSPSSLCGGGYPYALANPAGGSWGCKYPLDSSLDNWGMDNRECVSYTAWMVYKTYGYMPYWGGKGDANQWPRNARAAGIPTGSTPKADSVAIYMGGVGDPLGHSMWVKSVNSDGTITVDEYNQNYQGMFNEVTNMSSSGLIYIYFGG